MHFVYEKQSKVTLIIKELNIFNLITSIDINYI